MVAVATIAALPLFVLENPNSFGSATSVAGATETSLAATTASVSAPAASENSESGDPAPIVENVSSSPADETQALLILAEAKAQRILENAVSARQQQELSVFETAEVVSAEGTAYGAAEMGGRPAQRAQASAGQSRSGHLERD